jgi:hypothetical protein
MLGDAGTGRQCRQVRGRGEHGISERLRQTGDASSPGSREPRHSGEPALATCCGGWPGDTPGIEHPAGTSGLVVAGCRQTIGDADDSERPTCGAGKRSSTPASFPAAPPRFTIGTREVGTVRFRARQAARAINVVDADVQQRRDARMAELALRDRSAPIVTPDCPRGWRPVFRTRSVSLEEPRGRLSSGPSAARPNTQ